MNKEFPEWAMAQIKKQRKQQEEMLRLPEVPGVSVAGLNRPAAEISGDGYGIIPKRDINIFIFDVVGHGPETLITWTRAMTLMSNAIANGLSPLETAHFFAKWSEDSEGEKQFVSALVGAINIQEGVFSYVHLGHTWPKIFSREKGDFVKIVNGEDEYGNVKGSGMTANTGMVEPPPDGVAEELNYQVREIPVKPRDVIILYTDGLTEGQDKNNKPLGEEGLEDMIREVIVNGKENPDAKEIIGGVEEKLKATMAGIQPDDDCSMLVIVIDER